MQRSSLAQDIYEHLLASQRQLVTEMELVSEFGVSRTPIRAALQELEHRGIVQRSKSGVALSQFTPKQIADLYDVRAAVEGYAAGCAAQRCSAADIIRLRDIAQRYESALTQGLRADTIGLSIDFHETLVELTDNDLMRGIWRDCAIRSQLACLSLRISPEAVRDDNPVSHLDIVDVLAAKDVAQAESLVRQHIQWARTALLEKSTGIWLRAKSR